MSNQDQHSSAQVWTRTARWLHWATAALILIQIPLGFWMVEVYEVYAETYADDTWVVRTSMAHHTIGFLVLAIVLARLGWRGTHPAPDLPASIRTYQRWLARGTQGFLYALLVIYPLTGWAALSAYEGEFPIYFLGWDSVPRIVPQVPVERAETALFNYEFFAEIHKFCWRIGAVVLGLHLCGALWHQFVARDSVLRRMWVG